MTRVAERDGKVAVTVTVGGKAMEVIGSHLLVATGRRPNTDDLGLDKARIASDERGYIKVDSQLRTNVPGIFAMGDCNGRGAFTHTSYNDFEIIAANLSRAKNAGSRTASSPTACSSTRRSAAPA